jgi:sugar lactone lactonase YvrE
LGHYTNEGELVRDYGDYRRPISLTYDAERRRLWFLDAYDYKLVCFDADAGREIFNVRGAAHAPAIGTSDLGVYVLEKKPFEPSLALDASNGSVWVADFYGHEVGKYDAEGKEVFRSAAFHEPFAIAVLGDCDAWVSGGVRTLSLVGPQCETYKQMTGVNEARDLAYDAARDLVWVADYRNNRVFAINREGRLKRKITGVELPERLAVDAERGTVWVATHYAGIVKISAEAEKITASLPEPESVAAVAVASDGKLWVAYPETEDVVCYSPTGEKLVTIRRVNGPTGVAAD